jgi:transcriptional regulator with XRE-family HTH domain
MRYSDSILRAIRNHFGLSQAELADYLGIDRSLLTHVEADRRSLPLAATWRLLPVLGLLPPPHGTASADPLPPDPAEATAATLDGLQWRLRTCRHVAGNLAFALERQLPRLQAARHRRALPGRLAALPPRAPLPGFPDEPATPDLAWAARMAENAVADLARFGVQARALLEARLAGLKAEMAFLEGALGVPPAA